VTQRTFYSGKKKAHTLKNQVVVYRRPRDGRPIIAALSPSRQGKVHDKKIYDQTRVTTPPGIKRRADTGYHGTAMETPHKKPKGGDLTPEQKESNRVFSSDRVKVEHGIGGMKRFGIASQRWRNPRRTHTIIMKNVAGLANWANG
jgi:hypothetical protein